MIYKSLKFLGIMIFIVFNFCYEIEGNSLEVTNVLNNLFKYYVSHGEFERSFFDSDKDMKIENNFFKTHNIRIKSWSFAEEEIYKDFKRILVLFDSDSGEFARWYNLVFEKNKWIIVGGGELVRNWENMYVDDFNLFYENKSILKNMERGPLARFLYGTSEESFNKSIKYFKEIEQILDVDIPNLKYYLCSNGREISFLTGAVIGMRDENYPVVPPLNYTSFAVSDLGGIIDIDNTIIYTLYLPDKQAIFLLGLGKMGRPSIFFRDGIAYYWFFNTTINKRDKEVLMFIKKNEYLSIEKLLNDEFYYRSSFDIKNAEAISFVSFLVDIIGIKKFLEIYPHLTLENCAKCLEEETGKSLQELEKAWKYKLSIKGTAPINY
jgi:hypothetical protein